MAWPGRYLTGTLTGSTNSADMPLGQGQKLVFDLSGVWTGSVAIAHSYPDSPTTFFTVETFTSNPVPRVIEAVQDGMLYRVVGGVTSGTATYRMGRTASEGE